MIGLSFVIDTSILIEIERKNIAVMSRLEEIEPIKEDVYITSPSYTEVCFGLLKFSEERYNLEINRLDKYKLLNTSKNSSKLLAEIKHHLSKKGVMIPIFDLIIASIALDCKMPLITLDEHFKRIPNLNVILI